jgi:hypothetical protein
MLALLATSFMTATRTPAWPNASPKLPVAEAPPTRLARIIGWIRRKQN